MATKTKLVALDCGETQTGIAILTEKGIQEGMNLPNEAVIPFMIEQKKTCEELITVIEDMRPYNMRITDGVIQTIKFIGQVEWRLFDSGINFSLIPRWQVKQWIFLQFRTMAEPEIIKKIDYSAKRKERLNLPINKRKQSPTFVYVDDRIVQRAMRIHWKIPKQMRVGEKAPYNLKDHSWQALALASYYIVLCKPYALLNLTTS